MRGRHIRGRWYTSRSRLTPANAGTTRYVAMAARRHGAHPRECGDDLTGGVAPPLTRGSPPRMRGRRGRRRERRAVRWLTPANAGTTAEYSAEGYFKEAHPRECGDDVGGMREIAKLHGSPPRMRGRRPAGRACGRGTRLTPANAGTTICRGRWWPAARAHPRECGDDDQRTDREKLVEGSPPRMRGRLGSWCAGVAGWGLTPANAGTTSDGPGRPVDPGAHPRECGDDAGRYGLANMDGGSPPRMRGRRCSAALTGCARRLTPANAGTTLVDYAVWSSLN